MSDWRFSFQFSIESHSDSISKFIRIQCNECALLWLHCNIKQQILYAEKPTIASKIAT